MEYAKARKEVNHLVEKEKEGRWKYMVYKTNEDFEDGMKKLWVGIKGILGKQAGEADKGIATLRAQKCKMIRRLNGRREVPVENYRKLGTPTTNKVFEAEFKNKPTSAEAVVETSKWEGSGSKEL